MAKYITVEASGSDKGYDPLTTNLYDISITTIRTTTATFTATTTITTTTNTSDATSTTNTTATTISEVRIIKSMGIEVEI